MTHEATLPSSLASQAEVAQPSLASDNQALQELNVLKTAPITVHPLPLGMRLSDPPAESLRSIMIQARDTRHLTTPNLSPKHDASPFSSPSWAMTAAPLHDNDGRRLGVLLVRQPVLQITHLLNPLHLQLPLSIGTVSLLVSGLLFYLSGRSVNRRISITTTELQRVKKANTTTASPRSPARTKLTYLIKLSTRPLIPSKKTMKTKVPSFMNSKVPNA